MSNYSAFLKKELIISFKDHPGVMSIVLHTDIDICQLNCYKCHNKGTYGEDFKQFFLYDELKEKLEKSKQVGIELIIISGGEPTLIHNLEKNLRFIKDLGFKIRLDTNGQDPETVENIKYLIDGLAVDIKIPIKDIYNENELKRYKEILYSTSNIPDIVVYNYKNKLLKTLDIMKNTPHFKYNILRTVNYPLFIEQDVQDIKSFVKSIGLEDIHNVNTFFELN